MAVHSGDSVEKVTDWFADSRGWHNHQSRITGMKDTERQESSGLQKGMGESEGWVGRMGLWTWRT